MSNPILLIDITGGGIYTVDDLLAASSGATLVSALNAQLGSTVWQTHPSGSDLVTALNTQLGSTAWQGGGSGTPAWGAIVGTLSSQTDLQAALNAKAASSHTHTLSQISDVTVTSDMVSIPKGIRPGLYNDLGTPPVGTIFEGSNDGHLYWCHRDGSVHLLCDSHGYGGGSWGSITGTLSDQTDLQAALDDKQDQAAILDAIVSTEAAATSDTLMVIGGSTILNGVPFPTFGQLLVQQVNGLSVRVLIGISDSLETINGLTPAADTAPYYTGAAGASLMTVTTAARALLDDANAAAMRSTLGLVIGTNVQQWNAQLQALAGLTSAANKGIQFTGSGTAATFDLTAAAKTILDDASVDAIITTLGGAAYTGTGGLVRRSGAVLTGGFTVLDGTYFQDSYGFPSQTRLRRANGTQGSPTQVLSGQEIAVLGAQGFNSSGVYGAYNCYISFRAAEDLTSTGAGGYYDFFTTPVGSTTPANRLRIGENGNIGIGVTSGQPTTKLDVNGDMIRIRTDKTPATSSSAGIAGEICFDGNYLYRCVATNTWKRVALSTW